MHHSRRKQNLNSPFRAERQICRAQFFNCAHEGKKRRKFDTQMYQSYQKHVKMFFFLNNTDSVPKVIARFNVESLMKVKTRL